MVIEPDPKTPDPKEPEVQPDPKEPEIEDKTYTADEVKKIASEKKAAADTAKTLQVELDKLKAEKNKLSEDDLKKKGEYQKIIDSKEIEITDLKAKAAKVDELQEQLEAIETATKAELIEGLTKEQKEYCKDKKVSDIRAFVKLVGKNGSIQTDGGGTIVKTGDVKLTDAQKKEAETMGLNEKDFFEWNQNRNANLEKNKK